MVKKAIFVIAAILILIITLTLVGFNLYSNIQDKRVEKAHPFEAETIYGEEIRLEDFKGQIVILDFISVQIIKCYKDHIIEFTECGRANAKFSNSREQETFFISLPLFWFLKASAFLP